MQSIWDTDHPDCFRLPHGAPSPSPITPAAQEATDPHTAPSSPPPPRPAEDRPTPPVERGIERRTAVLDEVAESLRAMLGLDPDEPVPCEQAASAGHPLPSVIAGLDAGAWIAWCLAGLPLFVGSLPSLRRVKAAAGHVLVALAMTKAEGNLSRASALTRTSRKVLRDNLRMLDLYPWHLPSGRGGSGRLRALPLAQPPGLEGEATRTGPRG